MRQLTVGSVAMSHWFPSEVRVPKDFDIFTPDSAPTWPSSNSPNAFLLPAERFWDWSFADWIKEGENRDATPNELYTIKVSHSHWELRNNSYDKHLYDILFLRSKGAELIPGLYKLLYKVWEEMHGKKKVDLEKESMNFFKDAVTRKYDHDSIHHSVAFGDKAMYTTILKDNRTVAIDSKKMWALKHEDLVKLLREEVSATALERWLIPNNYKFSPGLAHKLALRKTITSLTKGKTSLFMIENIKDFIKPDNYLERHLAKLDKLIPLETVS